MDKDTTVMRFIPALQLLLIAAKLFGALSVPWWVVLLPAEIGAALAVLALVAFAVLFLCDAKKGL